MGLEILLEGVQSHRADSKWQIVPTRAAATPNARSPTVRRGRITCGSWSCSFTGKLISESQLSRIHVHWSTKASEFLAKSLMSKEVVYPGVALRGRDRCLLDTLRWLHAQTLTDHRSSRVGDVTTTTPHDQLSASVNLRQIDYCSLFWRYNAAARWLHATWYMLRVRNSGSQSTSSPVR